MPWRYHVYTKAANDIDAVENALGDDLPNVDVSRVRNIQEEFQGRCWAFVVEYDLNPGPRARFTCNQPGMAGFTEIRLKDSPYRAGLF